MTATKLFKTFVRPMLAEFFGQLIFAFLHSSSVHTISQQGGGSANNALIPAVSDGLTVAILVIIIGNISGAHVNFAVTTAVFIGGGIKWYMALLYFVAQMLGSLAGAGLAYVANGAATGSFALGVDVSIGQGVLMEIVLTSLLTLTVLMAAVELSSVHAAFAIGFAILIDIMSGFGVSGGCMNPTLSFGPAVVAGQWTNYWIYWVAPLIGALVSGTLFRLFFAGEARLIFKDEPQTKTPNQQMSMEPSPSAEVDVASKI